MVTAETTFSKEEIRTLRNPMTLFGIDWETYDEISEELGDSNPCHITFNRGTLTIMPVTLIHEVLTSLLQTFVTLAGFHSRLSVLSTGKATMRSKRRGLAVEPDASYFVQKANVVEILSYVPNELEGSPDIVAEIDFFHLSDYKFEIYAEFGVPEFWQFQDGKLKMFELQESSRYEEIERSKQIPVLTSAVLTEYLNRGETDEQFDLLTDFQAWLQSNK